MSTAIRIVIKIFLSFLLLFTVSALNMYLGMPAFIGAIMALAGIRAIIKWKPSNSVEPTIENETLNKD
jgi:hypothetical protein